MLLQSVVYAVAVALLSVYLSVTLMVCVISKLRDSEGHWHGLQTLNL